MENVDAGDSLVKKSEIGSIPAQTFELLRDKFIYNPDDFKHIGGGPPKINGKIIQLRPTPIVFKSPKPDQHLKTLHPKEPKFVPYEPYKGAVMPMVPYEKVMARRKKVKKQSVSSLLETKQEGTSNLQTIQVENTNSESNDKLIKTNERLEKELEKSQKENQHLENQLKFQIQVSVKYY